MPFPEREFPILTLILHWNQADECLRTVQSFLEQGLALDLMVIDNASRPEHASVLKNHLPVSVRFVVLERNYGWGGALNLELKKWLDDEESAPFCFVAAHDARPSKGCLALLLEGMKQNQNMGIACPQYHQPLEPRFSCFRGPFVQPGSKRPASGASRVPFPFGTLMLFRKACLRQIGLFDERFFAYGDEVDLGLRAGKRQWETGLFWAAELTNPFFSVPPALASYLLTRNALLLSRIYCGRIYFFLRVLWAMTNSIRLLIWPRARPSPFSFRSRMKALYDSVRGHYGPPDNQFFKELHSGR